MKHECIIGHLYQYDESPLTTLEGLKRHIRDNINFNKFLELHYAESRLIKKVYTLSDYGDKRKSTNLTRFDYCPECGKAIDWKAIRRLDHELRKDQ